MRGPGVLYLPEPRSRLELTADQITLDLGNLFLRLAPLSKQSGDCGHAGLTGRGVSLSLARGHRRPVSIGHCAGSPMVFAMTWHSSASCIPSSTTTNSSPASLATMSVFLMQPDRRSAKAISTASPASWPKVSLMRLKWSISMNISAVPVRDRTARLKTRGSCDSNCRRLARPVKATAAFAGPCPAPGEPSSADTPPRQRPRRANRNSQGGCGVGCAHRPRRSRRACCSA